VESDLEIRYKSAQPAEDKGGRGANVKSVVSTSEAEKGVTSLSNGR